MHYIFGGDVVQVLSNGGDFLMELESLLLVLVKGLVLLMQL